MKRNTSDDNKNERNKSSRKKPLLFLDSIQNNSRIVNKNRNHTISNTDTNLSSIIKVNVKLNKEKEYTPMGNINKRKKLLKEKIKLYDSKYKQLKSKQYSNCDNKVKKIILIQKSWKKYINNKKFFSKVEIFFNLMKRIIHKKIMKFFFLYLYDIKYYFLKWYHLNNYKKIIDKIKIYLRKNFISKTMNINKISKITHIKNKNLTGIKKQKNLKKIKNLDNCFTFQKNNQKNVAINTNRSNINDNFFNSYNINNNSNSNLEEKNALLSSFSSKNNGMYSNRQRFFGKKKDCIYDNKKYSTLSNNKNFKLIFKTIDANNLNIINSIKNKNNKYCNKDIKTITNEHEAFNRIRKFGINNKNKTNDKKSNILYNSKKESDKIYNNKNKQEKNLINKINNRKNSLYINIIGNGTHNLLNTNILLNTEPNLINNSIIYKNNYTMNNYTLNEENWSKRKSKIIKDRYARLKKFDTCPLTFKKKKFQLYKKYDVRKFLYLWNEITIKNIIISDFIRTSKIIKLRKIFFNKIRKELLKILNIIILKKYFIRYKNIINKIIILKKLKIFQALYKNNKDNKDNIVIKNYIDHRNLKKGDIINNININNFINYTNNNINTFIPKSTKKYNIMSNSMKINTSQPNYYKSKFHCFDNFRDFDQVNIINTNFNFGPNRNKYNNKYNFIYKKNHKGILVNQINQIRMVFNLLGNHYKNNRPSLLSCFKKWKNYINNANERYYNNNTYNENKNEKNRIQEKIINFKKINMQNKNKKNNIIKQYEIKNIGVYTYKPRYELECNKYININNNKNINSARQSNILNDYTFETNRNKNNSLRKNNKRIRYIEINKNIVNNTFESSTTKNNYKSEIIYQKKILNFFNFNHSSNIINFNNFNNYPNHNNIITDNQYSFKKVNKIEEREVHFNSLSKNKNNTYNKIQNNFNLFNNNSYRLDDDNNKKKMGKDIKKRLSSIRIDNSNINDKNLCMIDNNYQKNHKNSFNEIKNLFSKKKIIDNKKVNQTFCGLPINLQDEFG